MSSRQEGLFFAGQLAGVEGYVESIAHGLLTAINAAAYLEGRVLPQLPADTMTGALQRHLSWTEGPFQPMNANMGLLPPAKCNKRELKARKAEWAIASLDSYLLDNTLFRD